VSLYFLVSPTMSFTSLRISFLFLVFGGSCCCIAWYACRQLWLLIFFVLGYNSQVVFLYAGLNFGWELESKHVRTLHVSCDVSGSSRDWGACGGFTQYMNQGRVKFLPITFPARVHFHGNQSTAPPSPRCLTLRLPHYYRTATKTLREDFLQ